MTTIDAILHCDSDVEIYELLNVYADAAHLAEHTDDAPSYPLVNVLDVMQTMRALFIALGLVSRRLNDDSRIVIKEALCVFHVPGISGFVHSPSPRCLRVVCRSEARILLSLRYADQLHGQLHPWADRPHSWQSR